MLVELAEELTFDEVVMGAVPADIRGGTCDVMVAVEFLLCNETLLSADTVGGRDAPVKSEFVSSTSSLTVDELEVAESKLLVVLGNLTALRADARALDVLFEYAVQRGQPV